jgi:membrane-bound serine protease (ClpP class)
MLSSKVPVAVWVGPSGSGAASAGFFILVAADVAAMAPGTRTGAASGVFAGGENKKDDVLWQKANQDLAALIRSIAERRGRDVEACEKAVFEAHAYTETDALEKRLVDLVAADRDALLQQLDGREVRSFDGTTRALALAGARFEPQDVSFRHRVMEVLALPWVSYLLLLGGLLGLYTEFTHPGVVFPGVVGALCLLLFAVSAQTLPIRVIGILLVLLAFVMFILEIKVVSYGMLTVGGAACLFVGSLLLIDGPIPEMRVRAALVLPLCLAVAGFCTLVVYLAAGAQRGPITTGVEGLVGEAGAVVEDLRPAGRVFVHGEVWNASASGGATIPRGARVRVVGVDAMRLTVETLERDAAERS